MAATTRAPTCSATAWWRSNAKTGKYLWHFQATHHDIWDCDLDTPPVLLDVKKDGKTIPAVAAMNKNALLFILDRVTGKPIYGVTETPVPASPVAERECLAHPADAEQAGATGAQQLRSVRSGTADAGTHGRLPEDDRRWSIWTGSVAFQPIPTDHAIIRFPGGEGGPEWAGGAFDPKLGLFIVNTNNLGYVEQLKQQADGEWGMTSANFRDRTTPACRARRRPGAC